MTGRPLQGSGLAEMRRLPQDPGAGSCIPRQRTLRRLMVVLMQTLAKMRRALALMRMSSAAAKSVKSRRIHSMLGSSENPSDSTCSLSSLNP